MLLCFNVAVYAQSIKVSGTITDAASQPLVGANVIVKGTTRGAISDFDGNYSISASAGETLIISYTGFKTTEIKIGNSSTVNITLAEDTESLDEVILIGYGSRKKSDVVSAVSTVDKDFLEQQPSADATRALQGSASGVTVVSSARPGQQAQIRIRGLGSINGNSPLFIVDGVTGGSVPPPDQIESMQVLKDASSTAIYGARGASGVILITTKSGRKNQAPKFQFNVRTGVGKSNANYDLVTDPNLIGQMIWLEQTNDGVPLSHAHFQFDPNDIMATRVNDYLYPNGASIGDAAADPSLYNQENYPITLTNKAGTNWMDESLRSAFLQDFSLAVSGGSEKTTYSFNASIFDEEGVFKYNSFNRYAFRSNVESQVTDWLKVGQRLGATLTESKGNIPGFNTYVETSPLIPLRDIGGNWAGGIVGGNLNDGPNPVATLYRNRKDLRKTLNLVGNFHVEIAPAKNLKVKSLFGYNMNWFSNHDPRFGDPENTNGSSLNTLTETRSNNITWNFTNTVNYSKTFADLHNVDVLVGMESTEFNFDTVTAGREDFLSTNDDFYYLSSGGPNNISNGSDAATWKLFSLFSRVFYSYDDKYIVEGTIRRDGSSRFGANNRYGYFPAASLGWVVTKENFMEGSSDWLNQLKFRAGWGQSGNDQIGNYNGFSTFGSGLGNSYYGISGNDNTITQGYQSTAVGNPDAKWETTESLNIGIDATLFRNLDLSVDIWNKTTKDMLFRSAIPAVNGQGTAPFVNVGNMDNNGLDIELNYRGSVNNDLSYSIGLNVSTYTNEVTKLSSSDGDALIGRSERGQTYTRAVNGRSFPEFYGYIIDGIFQTQAEADAHPTNGTYNEPGNLKVRDVSGPNGVPDGIITADDRTWIGNPHPDFTAGLNLGIQYKNFDLSSIWYASVGNDIVNYHDRFTRWGLFQGPKAADRLFKSWGSPYLENNADAVLPKASGTTSFEQNTNSEHIEDGSFLRMKSIQLGYNLPDDILNKFGLSSMRVYVMGTNLITLFDNYSGLDVEVSPENEIDRGFDQGTWPQPKQFIFGVNIGI